MKIISLFLILSQFQIYALLCSKDYLPVCANGVTYTNACMAESSGATDIKNGACEVVEKKKNKPSHVSPPKPSTCVCPMIWKPVCGVDGKTYGSSCNARCKGVPIKHQGACDKIESH
ncbi:MULTISPECIES: Kazal-type serine protease inhibitor family protein [unclassified Halobacteriovorax]|uniref:Kazal-type serine protease inhibitor family protein n=1 Tax=unclassified Halobacteriovorax TaxID=2639665 RepID=UPI000EA3E3D5|nr:Kazal-type serine protease inhibitor family protein [Halobacteriovorax sp. BALOs_7]AYF45391.1 Kazal-type serine protease inhibitor domain protein [Halobacteriovorax sp. BALOs_7]